MEKIKVTMDGQVYEVDKFSAITEFVHAHMQENKQKYVLAFCNRKLCELGKLLDRDVELKLVEKTSVIGMDTYKRSLTFRSSRSRFPQRKQYSGLQNRDALIRNVYSDTDVCLKQTCTVLKIMRIIFMDIWYRQPVI